jgi:hypothetical protein
LKYIASEEIETLAQNVRIIQELGIEIPGFFVIFCTLFRMLLLLLFLPFFFDRFGRLLFSVFFGVP